MKINGLKLVVDITFVFISSWIFLHVFFCDIFLVFFEAGFFIEEEKQLVLPLKDDKKI